jgi:hypothetical protein
MSTKIFLLGFSQSVLADVQQQVARPGLEFFRGTNLEDMRAVLARTDIDHAIMGAKLPLETRLEMVRAIFEASDRASVHMRPQSGPGPEGFLPFVQAVLRGVIDDEG